MDDKMIENNFKTHETSWPAARSMDVIRNDTRNMAYVLNEFVPDCREKEIALTKLEEVMFWANAGISRNDVGNW